MNCDKMQNLPCYHSCNLGFESLLDCHEQFDWFTIPKLKHVSQQVSSQSKGTLRMSI